MRWSRRKRRVTTGDTGPKHNIDASAGVSVSTLPAVSNVAQPTFDLECLPPIESIEAGTDIREFLATGVPTELASAALRRAWSSDSMIRDFIGLSENAWDFNAIGGIPGFGSIADSEVELLVTQFLGHPNSSDVAPSPPARTSRSAQPEQSPVEFPPTHKVELNCGAATQSGSAASETPGEQLVSSHRRAAQREPVCPEAAPRLRLRRDTVLTVALCRDS